MFLVLFAVLFITVILVDSTFDKQQKEAIRNQVIEEVSQGTLKFENSDERLSYINNQIQFREKTSGLDQDSLNPSILIPRVISVMTFDLGKFQKLSCCLLQQLYALLLLVSFLVHMSLVKKDPGGINSIQLLQYLVTAFHHGI